MQNEPPQEIKNNYVDKKMMSWASYHRTEWHSFSVPTTAGNMLVGMKLRKTCYYRRFMWITGWAVQKLVARFLYICISNNLKKKKKNQQNMMDIPVGSSGKNTKHPDSCKSIAIVVIE